MKAFFIIVAVFRILNSVAQCSECIVCDTIRNKVANTGHETLYGMSNNSSTLQIINLDSVLYLIDYLCTKNDYNKSGYIEHIFIRDSINRIKNEEFNGNTYTALIDSHSNGVVLTIVREWNRPSELMGLIIDSTYYDVGLLEYYMYGKELSMFDYDLDSISCIKEIILVVNRDTLIVPKNDLVDMFMPVWNQSVGYLHPIQVFLSSNKRYAYIYAYCGFVDNFGRHHATLTKYIFDVLDKKYIGKMKIDSGVMRDYKCFYEGFIGF